MKNEISLKAQKYLPTFLEKVKDSGIFDMVDEREGKLVDEIIHNLSTTFNDLVAHKDFTVGLHATDKTDLILDPKNVTFEIKY